MNEMKHTPEPWFVTDPMHGHATEYKCVQIGPDAMYSTLELKPEDARRIVAAVNACEGVSTEALESGVVAEMRAACESALEAFETEVAWGNPAVELLRAALAKAKGETP